MIVANGPLYFGCVGDLPGHHLRDQNLHGVRAIGSSLEWMESLDALLPPQWDRAQGKACIHIIHGWTVISFWDRSVDPRNKGNSTFFIPGIRTGAWALAEARKTFPSIFARFSFEISLQPSALAEVVRRFVKGV